MPEWWTYRLSDFLLFSPRTYYRMFERMNDAVWPAHVVLLTLGCLVLVLLVREKALPARTICTVLALFWIWIAWSFLWRRYVTINWAAVYLLPLFLLEAVLLILAGRRAVTLKAGSDSPRPVGLLLLALAVVGYPFIARLAGRDWDQAEVFGIAPDPTAVATLGVLTLLPGPGSWLPMVVPVIWCLISGLTLWAMHSPEAWIPPGAALLSLIGLSRQGRTREVVLE